MTVQKCLFICKNKGFPFAGLQWQIECYCGNTPSNGFEWAWPEKCNDRCAGDSTQWCGGSMAMNVYRTPIQDPNGLCVYDNPIKKVLADVSFTGQNDMSILKCKYLCREYKFYGVQHGDECHCGESDDNFLPSPSHECNMPCLGQPDKLCGGSWRMNVFLNKNETFSDENFIENKIETTAPSNLKFVANSTDLATPIALDSFFVDESAFSTSNEDPKTKETDFEQFVNEVITVTDDNIFELAETWNDDWTGEQVFTYINPNYEGSTPYKYGVDTTTYSSYSTEESQTLRRDNFASQLNEHYKEQHNSQENYETTWSVDFFDNLLNEQQSNQLDNDQDQEKNEVTVFSGQNDRFISFYQCHRQKIIG